jgi:hypothetical protein
MRFAHSFQRTVSLTNGSIVIAIQNKCPLVYPKILIAQP